jgi:hypothetical protein
MSSKDELNDIQKKDIEKKVPALTKQLRRKWRFLAYENAEEMARQMLVRELKAYRWGFDIGYTAGKSGY